MNKEHLMDLIYSLIVIALGVGLRGFAGESAEALTMLLVGGGLGYVGASKKKPAPKALPAPSNE